MRRGVSDAKKERLRPLGRVLEIGDGVVGDGVGQVKPLNGLDRRVVNVGGSK
jgi:hypothetical protein